MFQCTIEYVLHQQNLFFGGWNVFGKTEGHTSPNRKQITEKIRPSKNSKFTNAPTPLKLVSKRNCLFPTVFGIHVKFLGCVWKTESLHASGLQLQASTNLLTSCLWAFLRKNNISPTWLNSCNNNISKDWRKIFVICLFNFCIARYLPTFFGDELDGHL